MGGDFYYSLPGCFLWWLESISEIEITSEEKKNWFLTSAEEGGENCMHSWFIQCYIDLILEETKQKMAL